MFVILYVANYYMNWLKNQEPHVPHMPLNFSVYEVPMSTCFVLEYQVCCWSTAEYHKNRGCTLMDRFNSMNTLLQYRLVLQPKRTLVVDNFDFTKL